jgi:hypothetical protein
MQNYNNPAHQPPSERGYTPVPQRPPTKKGMSTGVKVLLAFLLVGVVGATLVVTLAVGGLFWFSRRAQEVAGTSRPAPKGLAGSVSRGAEAEPPSPTAEQRSAVAGGQSAEWEQQEMGWTVPQKWKKHSAEGGTLLWRSPGGFDAASLIANISPTAADFPEEASLNAFHAGAVQRKRTGEVDEVRWLRLDGVKGVMFRESAPESADSPQRLQWLGYRDYKGQKQLVTLTLASRGKDFARHEDALYGILYSTKLGQ